MKDIDKTNSKKKKIKLILSDHFLKPPNSG